MKAGCPLFVEAPAGLAAVSLALQSASAKPPLARQGSKARYAASILTRMGLQPGQGAQRYVWCDADAGVRELLRSYTDEEMLSQTVLFLHSFRRKTTDERRLLWEQLKAQGALGHGPAELARWMRITTANRLICLSPRTWTNTGKGGSTFGGDEFCTPAERLAEGLESIAGIFKGVEPSQFPPHIIPGSAMAVVQRMVKLNGLRGVRVLIDPPYQGTSAYESEYPRHSVVDDALHWQRVAGPGCVIAVCEAEPISRLVSEGWHAVEITRETGFGSRHFSKQKREWLTMNVLPYGPLALF